MVGFRRGTCAAAALIVTAGAARAADPPVVIRSFGDAVDSSGGEIAWGGDLDGDGHPDLLATSQTLAGVVRAYSGATGAAIRDFARTNAPGLGGGFAWAGDLDGDGVVDVLVGAHGGGDRRRPAGEVIAFSGATAAELYRVTGFESTDAFGAVIVTLGDATGDGVPDFAVSAPGTTGAYGGGVKGFSGADGAPIPGFVRRGSGAENLGRSMVAAGDVNGDGVTDVFVGVPNPAVFAPGAPSPGRVEVLSGADGSVLKVVPKKPGGVKAIALGTTMTLAGDLDRDGRTDVIVTGRGPSETVVLSGKDAGVLRRYVPTSRDADGSGTRVVFGGGDLEGDGIPDVLTEYELGDADALLAYPGAQSSAIPLASVDTTGLFFQGAALVPDQDGDGFGDLLVSGLGPTVQIVKLVPVTAPKLAFAFPLTRSQSDAAEGARGTFTVTTKSGTVQVSVSAKGIETGRTYGGFLEDARGAGTFTQVGELSLKGSSGSLVLTAEGAPPAALGVASLADLTGRTVEVRDGADVVLSAVLPFPAAIPAARTKLPMAPEAGSTIPSASGALSLVVNPKTGGLRMQVSVKGVPKGTPLSLEIEDAPGSGKFVPAPGAFSGTKYKADTAKGDPLPGGASTLNGLLGRRLRVLAGPNSIIAILIGL